MESFTFFSPFSGSFCSSSVRSGFDCFGSVLACLCLFVICVVI
ncbi:hypothetical protein MtrunA17_Chr1g0167681 [Medicago truncatula]|uniref:Uncharacterized protein n=1 Tax=Medicago truncatula TaxID=3880 RepID=A0A396JV83_MEDTR|nr:hypothetical protein MtrunA17_Chr1g0167681 [Medicago truncatula]